MRLSRRTFVGGLAACAAAAPSGYPECRVLDLGPACILRESLKGFGRTGIPACPLPIDRHGCLSYIVPAVAALPNAVAVSLSDHVRKGGWLIFESAGGFGDFEAQREQVALHFGLTIHAPIDLWAAESAVPYIDYRWPVRTKVRDFSRIVPVSADAAEIIGTASGIPVAASRGRFVFLGSPIGPSLLAGDREAHLWLNALVRQTASPR